jgi:hypothetical protein
VLGVAFESVTESLAENAWAAEFGQKLPPGREFLASSSDVEVYRQLGKLMSCHWTTPAIINNDVLLNPIELLLQISELRLAQRWPSRELRGSTNIFAPRSPISPQPIEHADCRWRRPIPCATIYSGNHR